MDIKRPYYGMLSLALFLAPIFSSAACTPLTRTLSLGARGEDVRTVQRILNSQSETMVAITGPGSSGNETTYLGAATFAALKKFQLQHASEVLTPGGLTLPTGIVGKFTREAINRIACATNDGPISGGSAALENSKKNADAIATKTKVDTAVSAILERLTTQSSSLRSINERLAASATGTMSTPLGGSTVNASMPIVGSAGTYPLQLFSLGPMVALRGARVSMTGTGFSNTMRLRLGANTYSLIGGPASDTATFIIPADAPLGAYRATLEDRGATSNARWLIIPQNLSDQPVIDSISPTTGNVGTMITVKGKHFDTKNFVTTSFGVIDDVPSSDGTTLSISLSAKNEQLMLDGKLPAGLPYFISIVNKYGASNFLEFKIQ